MTHTNHPPRRPERDSARRRRAANYSDAVVAAYVHEISARHREPRRRSEPTAGSRGARRAAA